MNHPSPLAEIRSSRQGATGASAPALPLPPRPTKGSDGALELAQSHFTAGRLREAREACEALYQTDACRTDNLLLLGAVHFQLRNFSESIFYNQQAIRVDPDFAEAYSNLGNALKELGDLDGASQFFLKAIKLKPRFADAYNNLAGCYMQMGRTKQAAETYRMAIVLNPQSHDAHSNLGTLFKAQGRLEDAKKAFLEAIRIKPDFAIAWSNLAGVFKEEGQLVNAVAYYREAIRLSPALADAHSNLGNTLKESGKLVEAEVAYREAIKLRPDFAVAHGNLALCLYEQGRTRDAVRTFRHAIQLEPNFPDAFNNLGNALREDEQLDEAIQCYKSALELKPDHPHAYNNLGNALKDKGMVKEAVHCYMTAARLMPKFAAAHSNLGSLLKEQGKVEQALAHYQEAVRIDPLFADAYSNMGNAYKELNHLDDAIKCYTTAIKIDSELADAYSNLASAYKDGGRVGDAITCLRKALELKPRFADAIATLTHALATVGDWRGRKKGLEDLEAVTRRQLQREGAVPSLQPFHALHYPISAALRLEVARRHAARAKASLSLVSMPPFTFIPKPPEERLRVGYVSSDFGNHPLSHLMQSVFGLHNRERFDVFCYSTSASDNSSYASRIRSTAEHFVDLSELNNAEAATRIHADGIHVLIDLNGFTRGARTAIFALNPAPLQIAYMGFCGSMQADYIHYTVADRVVVPPSHQEQFSEKLLYVPNSFFVNDHRQSARAVLDEPGEATSSSDMLGDGVSLLPKRADYGLQEDTFVFCCFSQVAKMDPNTFKLWMKILKKVPNSVLWLLRFPPLAETNLLAEAKEEQVSAERLHFSDVVPKAEHLARCRLADLSLDTMLFNGHTTSCDMLWGGTPVLTRAGESMAARVGASLLKAAGLPELIASTEEEYVELAVSLATDRDQLFALRQRLENSRESCALFDTPRWVRNFEKALGEAWRQHEERDDEPRGHIEVQESH